MTDIDPWANTRLRLGFIVEAIDAGAYRWPGDAADDIIDVLLSVLPSHRADLLALIESRPLSPRIESGEDTDQ